MFDPRRSFQLQGFTGRGATTTIHDAADGRLRQFPGHGRQA
jgi:hypothetical protein